MEMDYDITNDFFNLNNTIENNFLATQEIFSYEISKQRLPVDIESTELKKMIKINDDYFRVKDLDGKGKKKQKKVKVQQKKDSSLVSIEDEDKEVMSVDQQLDYSSLNNNNNNNNNNNSRALTLLPTRTTNEVSGLDFQPPEWHAPWKLSRVIAGHVGWVRCVSVDPSNDWFVTGSNDKTIMVWDLATGQRKITLTGHIHNVRGLVVSPRHPYLFSCGEDKMVKCWDLERNKVIRHYHGHLSGVYCIALHPTLDVLMTGGRDGAVRIWDARTRHQIHCLSGHTHTIAKVVAQSTDPQIISSSFDSTIRCWDLAAGKCDTTLTYHKKAVRGLVLHPTEYTFASASADNIKKWKLPEAKFLHNLSGHNSIINDLSINHDNVLVSGGDDGSLQFRDWKTGYCFQETQTIVQPGSLESEAGICAMTFDVTGTRLITCESDKTIKIWKEDPDATPETHPVKWKPNINKKKW
eukprot:TRINITY_DN403_c0_g1_i1.p1 TRINITY_DN403_c0_g1~~TRINITY_DN403_c0_g1_i1.p1  ORF type:complete len:466 (-),score=147.77 TRINITY_DN403_c0_g1_i1:254-1651(-)